ncbi:MAG: hypothetical protein WAM14_13455 [Candidatus Nitrosopolaris sp.]
MESLGDIVPADVKLFDGDYLLIDQSALTEESLPVEKHLAEDAYSGSIVQKGEMIVITHTLPGYNMHSLIPVVTVGSS